MYSASKHGVRALLKQSGTLPEGTPAPACQIAWASAAARP